MPWESTAAHLSFAAELDSAMYGANLPHQHPLPVPSGPHSGGMLDSVLDLAFDQHNMFDDLTQAFALPTDDSLFWNQFLASPPIFVPAPAQDALEQTRFPKAHPPLGHSKRPQILITANGLLSRGASRPGSRPNSPPPADSEEVNAVVKADKPVPLPSRNAPRWPLRWNPAEKDSTMTLDPQVASPAPLAMPASTSLPRFDEQVRMALLETLRFAQLSDNEYHAVSSIVLDFQSLAARAVQFEYR